MSNFDPFDQLGPDPSHTRRRDLREKSTGRSRRLARKRAGVDRKARATMRSGVNRSLAGGPQKPGKPKKTIGKRIWSGVVSVVALSLAAAFALATVGSPLLFSGNSATAASVSHATGSKATINGQNLTAAPGKEPAVNRGSFQALTANELYAMKYGDLSYTVHNSGLIRWPFNFAVPINSPFGARAAPCSGCSTFHRGTDFDTGDGSSVYAVAAGVVSASEMAGSYGQYVAIDHDVKGYKFTSIYAHLRAGSSPVKVGDVITKGEVIGLTGCTGECTGAHLDFEIDVDGTAIDSFVWLKAHTAR